MKQSAEIMTDDAAEAARLREMLLAIAETVDRKAIRIETESSPGFRRCVVTMPSATDEREVAAAVMDAMRAEARDVVRFARHATAGAVVIGCAVAFGGWIGLLAAGVMFGVDWAIAARSGRAKAGESER